MGSVEKYGTTDFCTESEKNTQPVARVGKKIPSALRVNSRYMVVKSHTTQEKNVPSRP